MTYEHLLSDVNNGILTITFNRPKALNALNQQLLSELKHVFEVFAPGIDNLKGIILTGSGERSFVAGADITEFTGINEPASGLKMSKNGHDIFLLIERFPKPVIAAINGFALGAGCEVAMACHLRVATESSRFGQPEVNLGIIPGYGGTQRLVQLIGKSKAMELLLTADIIKADEAYRLGLINHVVKAGEELTKATEIIEKIATKAPIAVAKIIECVNAYFDNEVDGFAKEVTEFARAAASEDFQEGAKAFMEKRPAQFKGA